MNKQVLGLYIGDESIAGVVIEQQGRHGKLVAFASISFNEGGPLSTPLDSFFDRLQWQGGECICGFSLAFTSVRNLELPFADRKNIAQALPFELDDQLIHSSDELITDFSILNTEENSSQILAFAVEKALLAGILDQARRHGVDPVVVVPAAVSVADAIGRRLGKEAVMIMHGGANGVELILLGNGGCRACRYLPYALQNTSNQELDVLPVEAFRVVGAGTLQTLGFAHAMGMAADTVDRVIITGALASSRTGCDELSTLLGIRVETIDINSLLDIDPGELTEESLRDPVYSPALCLALHSSGRKAPYNFRQGNFAYRSSLLASRKQVMAAATAATVLVSAIAGFFLVDHSRLTAENNRLQERMEQLYRSQFPSITRVQDPYVQMQVALREVQATETEVPIYAGKQQMLDVLADISARIPERVTLQVSRLVADHKGVRMRGVTETFNNVNEIKGMLSRSPRYSAVKIVSATADAKTKKIRFELQLDIQES